MPSLPYSSTVRSPRTFCLVKAFKERNHQQYMKIKLGFYLQDVSSYKSMGLRGLHPWLLKELASVLAGLLCIVLERWAEIRWGPWQWKTMSHLSVLKKKVNLRNYNLVSLTLLPWKNHWDSPSQGTFLDFSGHVEEKKLSGMDSLKVNHAMPTWLRFRIKWLDLGMTSATFQHCLSQPSCIQIRMLLLKD